jgi:hypothetical protein
MGRDFSSSEFFLFGVSRSSRSPKKRFSGSSNNGRDKIRDKGQISENAEILIGPSVWGTEIADSV